MCCSTPVNICAYQIFLAETMVNLDIELIAGCWYWLRMPIQLS